MNKSGFGRTEKVGTPKQLLYTVIILISVVVIGVCVFLKYYSAYIDSILYAERPDALPGNAAYKITVSDTGCGMTKEFISHIFEPFSHAENSVTNRQQGTGLGLAITQNLVDLMGGTISVISEPGKGSSFDVTLNFAQRQTGEIMCRVTKPAAGDRRFTV